MLEITISSYNLVVMTEPISQEELIRIVTFTDDPGFFTSYPDNDVFYRSRFHPFISWIHELKGGKLEVFDEEVYQNLRMQDEAWRSSCWPPLL